MATTEFNDAHHYGIFTTSATLTSQTGKMVRQSELVLSALRSQGVFDNLIDSVTPPAHDKLWLDKNHDPAVLKEWDSVGSYWAPMTFDRLFGRAVITELENVAGTADAITVDAPSTFISERLYSLTPSADNMGAVTIQVAGVGTYAVKYHDGTDVEAGEFSAGDNKLLLFTGGRFEVVVPFSGIAASVSAAEDAADRAEAAAASIDPSTFVKSVADKAAMTAFSAGIYPAVSISNGGAFDGVFYFDNSDRSSAVAADPKGGIYIPPDEDATGASGVWVRQGGWALTGIDFRWFDPDATDWSEAIQAAVDLQMGRVNIPSGMWTFGSSIELPDGAILAGVSMLGASGVSGEVFTAQSYLEYTGSDVAFKSSDETSVLNRCTLQDFNIYAADASWIFDLVAPVKLTMSGVDATNDSETGGILRSRRISGQASWVNKILNCDFTAASTSTAYVFDVDWTDSRVDGGHMNGGKGCRWSNIAGGNLSFTDVQFETSVGAGLTITKEGSGFGISIVKGCKFDSNAVRGLYLDAANNPSGAVMQVTVDSCSFRSDGTATDDIGFADYTSKIKGVIIRNCQFANPSIATPINYDSDKWELQGLEDNFYSSGWDYRIATAGGMTISGATTGINFASQPTTYSVLRGNTCRIKHYGKLNAKGSNTGSVILTGALHFPAPTTAGAFTPLSIRVVGGSAASLTGDVGAYATGTTIVLTEQTATGDGALVGSKLTDGFEYYIEGEYDIA